MFVVHLSHDFLYICAIHIPMTLFPWKVFRIGTVRYNWPMSAHASQAFSIAHGTDSEDLPFPLVAQNLHLCPWDSPGNARKSHSCGNFHFHAHL